MNERKVSRIAAEMLGTDGFNAPNGYVAVPDRQLIVDLIVGLERELDNANHTISEIMAGEEDRRLAG